jgi:cell division FtsZ-interacting protein ZapD
VINNDNVFKLNIKLADSDFSKSGILQLILDVYEKERTANDLQKPEERQKIIQSIFFDSISIDQPLTESLLDFIEKTNKREVLST